MHQHTPYTHKVLNINFILYFVYASLTSFIIYKSIRCITHILKLKVMNLPAENIPAGYSLHLENSFRAPGHLDKRFKKKKKQI